MIQCGRYTHESKGACVRVVCRCKSTICVFEQWNSGEEFKSQENRSKKATKIIEIPGIVMKIPQVFFTYSVSPMRDAMLLASKYGIIKQTRSWSRAYPPTPICTITSLPTQLARNIAYAKYVDGLCSYLHPLFFVCGHDFPASLQLPGFKHKLRQVLKSANYDVVA